MDTEPDSRAQKLPGESGIWIIVGGDLVVFGLFFLTFSYYSVTQSAAFSAAKAAMPKELGLINVVLLLTSSWCVATAVGSARTPTLRRKFGSCLILFAIICGLGFLAVKFFEYRGKIRAGNTLNSDDFHMLYYMFTGIHMIHVVAGILALIAVRTALTRNDFTARDLTIVESGGIFWHLVDLLWVILFALFYIGM